MAKLLDGHTDDIIQINKKALSGEGMSDSQAMHLALKHANKFKAVKYAKKKMVAKKPNKIQVK